MISMTGFLREPAELRTQQVRACQRVIESGWYVLGPEVDAFEAEWAAACGATYAIGVASGMDAVEISLRALGIGAGDEVITTPMTAFASVLAIIRAGAIPVLADIDPATGLLSIDSAQRCLSQRTKAVVLVHLYGQVRDMGRWTSLCSDLGIALVEDCAQSHLATLDGRSAGTFGPIGAFSFYPTKNLGAIGDAGAVLTSDPELAAACRQLRNYGQGLRYHHHRLGLNSRLDEIQAALLRTRLAWLPVFLERRREIANSYALGIDNAHVRQLASPETFDAHVYHQYVVLTDNREAFMHYLASHGIESLIHYPVPVHRQPAARGIQTDPLGLPAAESFSAECVSIPCHPQLTAEEVSHVIDVVQGWPGA